MSMLCQRWDKDAGLRGARWEIRARKMLLEPAANKVPRMKRRAVQVAVQCHRQANPHRESQERCMRDSEGVLQGAEWSPTHRGASTVGLLPDLQPRMRTLWDQLDM